MRPGRFSQAGFLGPEEHLRDVLECDAGDLDALNVTAGALADGLGGLLAAAIDGAPTITRAGRYRVRLQHFKGPQACPFAPRPHQDPCPGPGDRRFAALDW